MSITENDLVYAAFVRCPCGAGMAYKKGLRASGYWDCSDILLGRADKNVKHTDRLPFAFYEIKSEQQPSANGATTRPAKIEVISEQLTHITSAQICMCPSVPKPKHDGKLDEDDDGCTVSFDDNAHLDKGYGCCRGVRIAGKYAIGNGEDEVTLSPKKALSLLAWLEQERETLEQLAKEQGNLV